ncbi:hypothetical protein IE81DRAFT_367964 [Ceraceosorus guamensis]|uniref:Uncharacterized protein n=1 Tax=Ceraceosorus guamensis TaxID=1522189 RepID=A0A316VTF7_9BASI|nr:hypothetical protein IE81DRAFT_367964 [Ceraceosorus guamensis]PWN40867.1 hypothetical protein IE81DRAFT_367964 [Ceraceosorus guamensis]
MPQDGTMLYCFLQGLQWRSKKSARRTTSESFCSTPSLSSTGTPSDAPSCAASTTQSFVQSNESSPARKQTLRGDSGCATLEQLDDEKCQTDSTLKSCAGQRRLRSARSGSIRESWHRLSAVSNLSNACTNPDLTRNISVPFNHSCNSLFLHHLEEDTNTAQEASRTFEQLFAAPRLAPLPPPTGSSKAKTFQKSDDAAQARMKAMRSCPSMPTLRRGKQRMPASFDKWIGTLEWELQHSYASLHQAATGSALGTNLGSYSALFPRQLSEAASLPTDHQSTRCGRRESQQSLASMRMDRHEQPSDSICRQGARRPRGMSSSSIQSLPVQVHRATVAAASCAVSSSCSSVGTKSPFGLASFYDATEGHACEMEPQEWIGECGNDPESMAP